jgi:hypothetical protein
MDAILKKDMKITENRNQKLDSFEKSFGYRLKKMTDDEELPFSAYNADQVFKKDAEVFQNKVKKQFIDFRQTFSDIINRVRTE